MRPIDADELIKFKVTGEIGNLSGDFIPGFAIENAPTIEAEPVRYGELISTGFDEIYCEWGNCSNCGADNMMSSKRCCECGTRFDGRDDKK